MKKILTILAAVTGLAAFGTVPEFKQSGTSFESYGDRPFDAAKDDAGSGSDAGRYWYTTDTDAANVLSNYVGDVVNADQAKTPTGVSRPDYFAPSNNTKYLSVETTGKLFRTLKENSGNDEFVPYDIPVDGIYLDTLVKFTAADSVFGDDALADGDKIAIEYVEHESEGGDDPTITNFVIRAGYVGANGVITPTNYFAAVPAGFNKDAWHRLTVRTIAEVGSGENSAGVGFVVYLDQVPLAYSTSVEPGIAAYTAKFNSVVKENFYKNDLHAIYPSAVDAEMTTGRNISAVAFSGNGAIDDVVFTTDRPSFIQESTTVDVVWDEHVATLRLNGQTINVSSGNATTIEPTNGVIDVVVTFATGYRAGAFTADKGGVWEASISCFTGLVAGATCTISSMLPLYEVNGVAFDDLDAAMTAAATGTAQAPATLKLLADCNQVLGFTDGYIVLDLNGCDVQGGDDADCTIMNNGATLVITNSGAEASVLLPTNLLAEPPITLLAAAGLTIVQAGTFEGIVIPGEGTLTITGGKFLDVAGTFDPADPTTFYLVDPINCVAPGVVCTKSGDYVQVGGGAEPQPTTYEVTWTLTGGTASATSGDDFAENDTIVFTADTGKTLSFVSINGTEIADTSVYGASSYTYTVGTAAATLVVTFTGSSYPSYIDDATKQGKYDTWKAAMTAAGVDVGDGEAYEDAYLLNCKPADVAAEKAAFKFTSISYDTTQSKWITTTTTKNTKGADYNGTVTVTGYSDVGCTVGNETEAGPFFKAFLQ